MNSMDSVYLTEEQLTAATILRSHRLIPGYMYTGKPLALAEIEELFETVNASFSSTSLKKWRDAVLFRDKYMCVMCGDDDHLESHHCKPKSQYPEEAYNVNNGITLCKRCHIIVVHGSNTFDLSHCYKFQPLWDALILGNH